MSAPAILVFGEALVDDFGSEQVVGGAPFNVARNLAAFGATPLMITCIGDDPAGALVRAEFQRFGMAQGGLQVDPAAATGRVVVERSGASHRFIILDDQAYDRIEAAPACAAIEGVPAATLYFGTLAQRRPGSRAALRSLFARSPAQRYLDLNVREGQVNERCVFESLHAADIVKVNEEELRDLFGWYTHVRPGTDDMDAAPVRKACAALMQTFGLEGLIVTLGERGSVYFGEHGLVVTSRAPDAPAVLVDTVGAGDAFSSVFLFGQQGGWPLALTLERANAFAAAVCGIAGAVAPDDAFYQSWRAAWSRA
jgi:fructokinase